MLPGHSLAYFQCGLWRDTITLCEHALKVTKDNYRAHFCMTLPLLEQERFAEAIFNALLDYEQLCWFIANLKVYLEETDLYP